MNIRMVYAAFTSAAAVLAAGCASAPEEAVAQPRAAAQEAAPQSRAADPFWAAKAPRRESRVKLTIVEGSNMPLAEAELDGVKCTLLVDTGATHTTFDLSFVKKALPDVLLQPVLMMGETNVEGAPRFMQAKSLKIGEAVFEDFGAMALDISHLHKAIGVHIDGILGMSTLGRVPCVVSLGGGELVFAPGAEALAGFGARVRRSPAEPMSVFLKAGTPGGVVEILVDSGASMTILSSATKWPATGEAVRAPAVDINGSSGLAPRMGEKGVLDLAGGIEIKPMIVEEPMNRLGADTLRAYDMLVAGPFAAFRCR